MLTSILFGSGYAFAAAIQPGPLQTFLLSRVAASGWRRTLPASLAPAISDGPIAVLAILVLGQLSPGARQALQAAGGLLLLFLAWRTFRQWRRGGEEAARDSAPRTLLEAVLVNLLNPNPYLGWTLVLGPAVHGAWIEAPVHAVALVVAFYVTMVTMLAGFIVLVGAAGYLGPRARHALIGLSATVLAGLGIYLVLRAVAVLTC